MNGPRKMGGFSAIIDPFGVPSIVANVVGLTSCCDSQNIRAPNAAVVSSHAGLYKTVMLRAAGNGQCQGTV